jgi:hypothetical protein
MEVIYLYRVKKTIVRQETSRAVDGKIQQSGNKHVFEIVK